jgi:hypothetical protein
MTRTIAISSGPIFGIAANGTAVGEWDCHDP